MVKMSFFSFFSNTAPPPGAQICARAVYDDFAHKM
uniref:Uncharacterized protein n=1 Tax=Arundo donax TaxID=35708 RepID=A0A0A9D417_ARUDO